MLSVNMHQYSYSEHLLFMGTEKVRFACSNCFRVVTNTVFFEQYPKENEYSEVSLSHFSSYSAMS